LSGWQQFPGVSCCLVNLFMIVFVTLLIAKSDQNVFVATSCCARLCELNKVQKIHELY